MTALAQERQKCFESWDYRQFTLKATKKAYKNGMACIETSSGKVVPGASASGLKFLGVFEETIDATSAGPLGAVDQQVNVNLLKGAGRTVLWQDNDGTITSANIGSTCYISDDQTVSLNSTTQSAAGTILAVDSILGVAFEVEGL